MKKFKFFIIFLSVFAIMSCGDDLDITPSNIIDAENAYNTQSDFESGAKGIYQNFLSGGYYGANSGAVSRYFMGDLFSDNVILNRRGRLSRQQFYEWRFSEGVSTSAFWANAYSVIQASNLILESIDKLQDGEFKNKIKGEALAARAIAHYDLVTLYGITYTEASDSDLGVPYVVTTDSELKPARETVKNNYDKILADLIAAEEIIGMSNSNNRFNQLSVNAFLSRIYLSMGRYQDVINAANKVDALGGSLASLSNFPDVWEDASDEGVLFKLSVIDPDRISIGVAWNQTSPSGEIRSEYNCSYDLFSLYENNDIRKNTYIETSSFDGSNYNHVIKYNGRSGGGNANVVNPKPMRYAEVLLNKAEAKYMLNDASALEDLNKLRAERYQGFVDGTEQGSALMDAINLERRLELAFEGDRFFTLKRQGKPVVRDANYGDFADGTGIPADEVARVLEDDSYKFQMAIGLFEMQSNPNMVQNPGY